MRSAVHRMNFRRVAVPPQQQLQPVVHTFPPAVRGLIMNESAAFMQPGGAVQLDNWFPTQRMVRLRGGSKQWSWTTESSPGVPSDGPELISSFKYVSGSVSRMYFAETTKVYDATANSKAVVIKSGQTNGNYSAAQLANAAGDYLIAVNDAGDYPLRFDGTTWETLNTGATNRITGPPGRPVTNGQALTYVCKYRSRMFFIQGGSMSAWYLPLNAVGGALLEIPLSGAATKGGSLLFATTWTIDAGDGLDDKIVFATTEGELLVFTGSDPSSPTNWRQEGRYQMARPMGKNAHLQVAGDILIATIDGIIPLSAAITKERTGMEMAAVTKVVEPLWKQEVADKSNRPWTMLKWDERGAIYVTLPGGVPGAYHMLVANVITGAWCRYVGWDAICFTTHYNQCFFGTQKGRIVQADVTGSDNGELYTCIYVGSWEHFGPKAHHVHWLQGRTLFTSGRGGAEPFVPQLTGVSNYSYALPPAPNAGTDPLLFEVWDEGVWDDAHWDAPGPSVLEPVFNTYWVSIGAIGYSFAPIVQVTIHQNVAPQVGLISIDAIAERLAVAV